MKFFILILRSLPSERFHKAIAERNFEELDDNHLNAEKDEECQGCSLFI